MGQEYFINSQELQSKVASLLPSQGGAGAGFDLSASTQIVPIIDLTESAEGSNVRADLQTAISFSSATAIFVSSATTTIINNTGYFRIIGTLHVQGSSSANKTAKIDLTDGATTKSVWGSALIADSSVPNAFFNVDLVVFLKAGDSCSITTPSNAVFFGSSRQIADIDGNLVNPT
jgi:hypothetical protein